MNNRRLWVAESAACGQPDKLCDLITDTILDEVLFTDRYARVDMDAMVIPGIVILAGEITTKSYVNLQAIARKVVREVGYVGCESGFESSNIAVMAMIGEQSHEVALVVDNKGAGNQCMCVGYATDEGQRIGADLDYLPLPQWLAHRLTSKLDEARKSGELPDLFPDGTSQVVVEYDGDLPASVRSVTVASHHRKAANLDEVRRAILEKVAGPVLALLPADLTKDTECSANHAGPFTIGGPAADIGLSGRKGVHDTYGTACAFGGSSPVGKDPTKTDRAALYMARYLAKNLVAAGFAHRAEVRLAYLLGRRDPIKVQVDAFGTGTVEDGAIEKTFRDLVDMSSPGIVEHLKLRQVTYAPLACHGCFGRPNLNLPWERLDLAEKLKKALG